jgi:drug/metabolite transporter (DMT)-like permease
MQGYLACGFLLYKIGSLLMKQTKKGALMLLLAALIWGMAFAAQTSASDEIGAFTFNASRSIIAAFF